MKKIIILTLTTLSLGACSPDDAAPVTDNQIPIEQPRLYKLGYDYGNILMSDIIVKTKTEDGPWMTHEFDQRRVSFHYGDSIHIIALEYLPDEVNEMHLQVHNRYAYFDEMNYDFVVASDGEPINKKLKLQFTEYEDYPIYE